MAMATKATHQATLKQMIESPDCAFIYTTAGPIAFSLVDKGTHSGDSRPSGLFFLAEDIFFLLYTYTPNGGQGNQSQAGTNAQIDDKEIVGRTRGKIVAIIFSIC